MHHDLAHPQKEGGEGSEDQRHDEIVQRDLNQSVVRISPGKLAPDKHHRGAGGTPRRIMPAMISEASSAVTKLAKSPRKNSIPQGGHGEGLDEPVHHERKQEPLRLAPHLGRRAQVYLDHHGVDHGPDGSPGRFQKPPAPGKPREIAFLGASNDGEPYQKREIAFKASHGRFLSVGDGWRRGRKGRAAAREWPQ